MTPKQLTQIAHEYRKQVSELSGLPVDELTIETLPDRGSGENCIWVRPADSVASVAVIHSGGETAISFEYPLSVDGHFSEIKNTTLANASHVLAVVCKITRDIRSQLDAIL